MSWPWPASEQTDTARGAGRVNRWTALDWLVTVGPFVILGGVAWCAVRRSRQVGRA